MQTRMYILHTYVVRTHAYDQLLNSALCFASAGNNKQQVDPKLSKPETQDRNKQNEYETNPQE